MRRKGRGAEDAEQRTRRNVPKLASPGDLIEWSFHDQWYQTAIDEQYCQSSVILVSTSDIYLIYVE